MAILVCCIFACKYVLCSIKFDCRISSYEGQKFQIYMDVDLPFLEIGVLAVLGLFFMNFPKKLNAPAE